MGFCPSSTAETEIGGLLDVERIARVTADVRTAISAFLEILGERVAARRRRAYEQLVELFPELLRRLPGQPMTLLHGDTRLK